MNRPTQPPDLSLWIGPPQPDDPKDPDYDAWVEQELREAIAEADAGKLIPAEQVWKDLGLG